MYNRIESYFNKADGGTIILKNIHLLNFDKQSVLLHILENEHPDVRVICTTRARVAENGIGKDFPPKLVLHTPSNEYISATVERKRQRTFPASPTIL